MLPAPKTPIYTTTLPSNGKSIKYRPWDGVMEKSLQIALMDEDKTTVRNTMMSIINECTYEALDVENLPDVDVDWLITQLRIKSVGELVELTAICGNCKNEYDIGVNLLEATVVDEHKDKRNKPVQIIDEDIYFTLNLPSKDNMEKHINDPEKFTIDMLITTMIKTISTSEQVFSPKDYSYEDLFAYVSKFNKRKMMNVYAFIDNLPKVVTDTKSTCRHCKTSHDIHLEGSDFFFV